MRNLEFFMHLLRFIHLLEGNSLKVGAVVIKAMVGSSISIFSWDFGSRSWNFGPFSRNNWRVS